MASRTVGKKILVAVLVFFAVLAVAALTFASFIRTDRGRAFAAERLAKVVTKNIPGSMTIGSLEQFDPDLVIANDVRFYHPNGSLVLQAKHAEVVPDLSMALHGKLGFERAAVKGGFILLAIDPDGRLGMEAAVDAPSKPGEPSDPNGGLHYALRSMHVENFTTIFRPSKTQTFKLLDTTGFVGIRRIETAGTTLQFEHIAGTLEQEIAGARLVLEKVDGWVHGKEKHVLHLDTHVKVGSGKVAATVDYFDRPKKPVKVQLHKTEGVAGTATTWLLRAAELFSDKIEVQGDG
jgi:hypothetical protein